MKKGLMVIDVILFIMVIGLAFLAQKNPFLALAGFIVVLILRNLAHIGDKRI